VIVPEPIDEQAAEEEGGMTQQEFLALLNPEEPINNVALGPNDVPKFYRDSHLHLFQCSDAAKEILRAERSENEKEVAATVLAFARIIYLEMRTEYWR
jgi:hypothetical protein